MWSLWSAVRHDQIPVVDTAILPPCLLRHRRFTTRAHPHLFEETRGGAGGKTIDLQPRPVAGFFIWYNRRRTLGFGIERGLWTRAPSQLRREKRAAKAQARGLESPEM